MKNEGQNFNIKKKNGKIEFLRFVFCLVIVLFHARNLLPKDTVLFKSGAFVVEFFAIVSGYLMVMSIEKQKAKSTTALGTETMKFLWKKIKNLYPEIIVAWVLAFSVRQIADFQGFMKLIKAALNGVFELLLLQMSGLQISVVNGVTWYISAMILGMAILYPLVRKYTNFMLDIGALLLAIISLGWLCYEYENLRTPYAWMGFAYKGTIRIFAELCLGIVCYRIVQWLQTLPVSKYGRVVLTSVEMMGYIIILLYMNYLNSCRLDYLFLFIWLISIAISFSGKGIDINLYDNKVCYFLGWLSMPLYLSHQCSVISTKLILETMTEYSVSIIWFIYMFGVILNCSIVVFLSKMIRDTTPKVIDCLKGVLIVKE